MKFKPQDNDIARLFMRVAEFNGRTAFDQSRIQPDKGRTKAFAVQMTSLSYLTIWNKSRSITCENSAAGSISVVGCGKRLGGRSRETERIFRNLNNFSGTHTTGHRHV
jgi:hypothetical protein